MLSPFGPRPAPSQTQRNDSQWGAGNWAYSRSPSTSPPAPAAVPSRPAPGQANPIAPKSQGTPYQAYAPQAAPRQTATGNPQGAYAAATANQRPPDFQMGVAQTPWGQSMDPFVERNAFINQINQQRMQNQLAFNTGGATNPAAGLTPGIDYQKAMQQAGLGNGAPSMSPNYGDSMISRLNQSFGGQGNPFAFAPQSAPQFAGMYAAGTDLTKLPFTDTMQPNPAYRPPVTPYQQPADPYASTTYAYPGGTWGHSPQQGQPTPSQGTQSGSRLSEWAAAGKPGNPEIQLMQIGKSRIDGTGFGSISEAAAYDRWLESQGVASGNELPGRYPEKAIAGGNLTIAPQFRQPTSPGWIPETPDMMRNRQSPGQPQPPAYTPPPDGTIRIDPASGKMVAYKDGQWTWQPNPISGPQPYDTSRFGDGTPPGPGATLPKAGQAQPIQPPSQGTPYGQPADPYAVNDLKSLPFYKSLRVGDKVRRRESGQYDVYDSSGVAVETYNPGRTEPSVSMKRAREPLFLHQNEGMTSQQLGDIQSQREKDAKQKAAGDAWIKGAPARLEKEREAMRNSPTGKQAQARIDQMQAEVANLERNLSKGSLGDKNAKLKRIRELKGQISNTAANFL